MGKTTVSGSDFPVNQSIEFFGGWQKKAIDGCENLGIIACVKNKGVEWFWLFDPCEDRNDDGDVSCNIQQESPAWCFAWCFAEESEFSCKTWNSTYFNRTQDQKQSGDAAYPSQVHLPPPSSVLDAFGTWLTWVKNNIKALPNIMDKPIPPYPTCWPWYSGFCFMCNQTCQLR